MEITDDGGTGVQVTAPTRAALAERLLEMSCRGGYSQRDVDDLEDAAAALLREPEPWRSECPACGVELDIRAPHAIIALGKVAPAPADEDVARELANALAGHPEYSVADAEAASHYVRAVRAAEQRAKEAR